MPTAITGPFNSDFRNASEGSATNQKPFVVVDLDGCLVDDVSERFGDRLRKVKSRLGKAVENGFEEGTFYGMMGLAGLLRSSVAKRNTNLTLPFISYVVDTLRALGERGYDIVVRSSNPEVRGAAADIIKARLEDAGVHAIVEYKSLMHKADSRNGERPSLLLDDLGVEGLPAAKWDVPTVVRKPGYHNYQLITDKALPAIFKHIYVADGDGFKDAALAAVRRPQKAMLSLA